MAKAATPSGGPVRDATGLTQGHRLINSRVIKRSIVVGGHKTSVSVEDQFWDGLHEIAGGKNMVVSALIEEIDRGRSEHNLSSAIRVYVLAHFKDAGQR